MAHTLRITALVVVLATIGPVHADAGQSVDIPTTQSPATSTYPVESAPLDATMVDEDAPAGIPLTADQQAVVDWAVARFAQVGLDLPELTVRFDPSRELCGFHEGLYRHDPNGDDVVTVCAPDADTFAADLQARRTLLHEFGHAWDFANLTDENRAQLAVVLGADRWNDPTDEWEDRGVERLAETFVFALLDQPRRPLKVSLDCSVLLEAFRTATGAGPLGPGLPPCAA